jgi:hypothetical protein
MGSDAFRSSHGEPAAPAKQTECAIYIDCEKCTIGDENSQTALPDQAIAAPTLVGAFATK